MASSLCYRESKNFNPKSLLHFFFCLFAGLERTPFCSWYIIILNRKVSSARENFLDAIQEGSSKIHLGQKHSTRLEGKVINCSLFSILLFRFHRLAIQFYNFMAAFSQVVTSSPSPLTPPSPPWLRNTITIFIWHNLFKWDLSTPYFLMELYLRNLRWTSPGFASRYFTSQMHWLVFTFGQNLLLLEAVFQLLHYLLHKGCLQTF